MLKSMHALNSQKKREKILQKYNVGFGSMLPLSWIWTAVATCIETWIFIRFGKQARTWKKRKRKLIASQRLDRKKWKISSPKREEEENFKRKCKFLGDPSFGKVRVADKRGGETSPELRRKAKEFPFTASHREGRERKEKKVWFLIASRIQRP